RCEPRLDSVYYELSHDTLVEPILSSRAKRERRRRQAARVSLTVAMVLVGALAVRGYRRWTLRSELEPRAERIEESVTRDPHGALVDAVDLVGESLRISNGDPPPEVQRTLAVAATRVQRMHLMNLDESSRVAAVGPAVAVAPRSAYFAVGGPNGKVR